MKSETLTSNEVEIQSLIDDMVNYQHPLLNKTHHVYRGIAKNSAMLHSDIKGSIYAYIMVRIAFYDGQQHHNAANPQLMAFSFPFDSKPNEDDINIAIKVVHGHFTQWRELEERRINE